MCGHVGIAGKMEFKDEDLMKRLLMLDYFRGKDSTGLANINSNEAVIAKIASHPLDLFELGKFRTVLNANLSQAFIGHNRAATRGAVSSANAHPYNFDHITGAHNGTLTHASYKALEDVCGDTFPTDSMAIFAAIAKIGIKATIELCEEGRDYQTGAWSLVWHDAKENSLNFLRNKHRPMFFAYSKECNKLFWASEWQMIDAAIATANAQFDLYQNPKTNYKYFQTEEDMHYKFDLDVLKSGADTPPKAKGITIKGKELAAATSVTPFGIGSGADWEGVKKTVGTTTTSGTGSRGVTGATHLHLIGGTEDPYAGVVTREEFEAIANYGCSWCSADITWGDVGITLWERDGIVLCADCSGNDTKSAVSPATRVYMTDLERLI